MDDSAALRAQVSENTGRRDLSYIERALFAQELLDSGFGSQAQIAEVLNVTRSSVSMSISVAKAIGTALARAIGPAHGVGRPRWEAMAKELADSRIGIEDLSRVALDVRAKAAVNEQVEEEPQVDPSVAAFEAVARYVKKNVGPALGKKQRSKTTALVIDGTPVGAIKRSGRGLRLDLTDVDDAFAEWLDARAQEVLKELHDRWRRET
jgi:ParB family chromosome partitioning protein